MFCQSIYKSLITLTCIMEKLHLLNNFMIEIQAPWLGLGQLFSLRLGNLTFATEHNVIVL